MLFARGIMNGRRSLVAIGESLCREAQRRHATSVACQVRAASRAARNIAWHWRSPPRLGLEMRRLDVQHAREDVDGNSHGIAAGGIECWLKHCAGAGVKR